MRLFLLLCLISFNVFATEWNELEIDAEYKLTQSFSLKQIGPQASSLDIMTGEKVVLKEIVGLDMIRVTLFQFEYLNCPGPEMKTDMEIIPVNNTSPVVEIGAQLVEKCTLEIFIESKDLMTESFLK